MLLSASCRLPETALFRKRRTQAKPAMQIRSQLSQLAPFAKKPSFYFNTGSFLAPMYSKNTIGKLRVRVVGWPGYSKAGTFI